AVPEDDVGLPLGCAQDLLVVDAGVDDQACVDVRLVLLALLDGAPVTVEIRMVGEALAGLPGEVAVGHGVPYGHDPPAHAAEDLREVPARLRLADAGTHGADR